MSHYNIIIFIFIIISKINCDKTDYCKLEEKLCKKGQHHIACSNKSLPPLDPDECINKEMYEIDPSLRKLLLKEHNDWRNQLAEGAIPGFPPATRMMKMHWDYELEFVAWRHANYCTFEHDKCRGTVKYPKSGQNLALKLYSRPYKNIERMIKEMCAEWFEEYKLLPKDKIRDIINEYKHDDKWGHFAVMAREKNDALGCALVSMENKKLMKDVPYHYMLTCHYADTNYLMHTIYDHGDACTRCDSHGPDYKCDKAYYHRLCNNITKESEIEGDDTRGKCNERTGKCPEFSGASKTTLAQFLIMTLMSVIAMYLTMFY